jgi:hypothetical protein
MSIFEQLPHSGRVGLAWRVGLLVAVAWIAMGVAAGAALAVGDANEANCPNAASPGFRVYLPDCRAYEMVSPPYKDGFPIQPLGYSSNDFSEGAPLFAASSLGAFGGSPDIHALGNDYEFRRTASGWETVAMDPLPTQYVVNDSAGSTNRGALAVTEDGTALMQLHTPSESVYGSELYRRTLAGVVSRVGPMLPESAVPPEPIGVLNGEEGLHFAGASADLSHVLFYIDPAAGGLPAGIVTNLWRGDTTLALTGIGEATSLYEYVGTDNSEPKLVGVKNSGPLQSNREAKLISQCGIGLGGPVAPFRTGNTHNAIAAGGDVVFLTASPKCPGSKESGPGSGPPTYELLARIAGERTVAISEPSPSECGLSAACSIAPPADANFEGASSDGSKAFFTSTQQLLPNASEDESAGDSASRKGCSQTTGPSGCNLYEYDFNSPAGQNLVLVSGGDSSGLGPEVQGVSAVSDDGSHVYFVAKSVLTSAANREGQRAKAGAENLYVFEHDDRSANEGFPKGHTTFIATLAESDSGQWSAHGRGPMNVTPDGRFLVFTSSADLTPGDTSTVPQVFRYDAQDGELARISIGNEGYNNNGNTGVNLAFIERASLSGEQKVGVDIHPSVSNDGSTVAFDSSAELTPQAIADPTNAVLNVYEYRAGHVYLISDGRTTSGSDQTFHGSVLTGISPSGSDIFFRSYGSLLPQDTDTLPDVYDARVRGGFSAAAGQSACAGDACQSPVDLTPALSSPATATYLSGSNLAPPLAFKPLTMAIKPLTRVQKLTNALKACRHTPKKKRATCESQARKRYGAKSKRRAQKKGSRRGK